MSRWAYFLLLLALTAVAEERPRFEQKQILIGKKQIRVEVADTHEKRAYGLMYKTSLPKDQGMLFVFEYPQVQRFWMKNTLIPLSIAYFDQNKKIVTILDMEPANALELSPKTYSSKFEAKFALEMNKGWFSKNGIGVGQSFEFKK